jgi:hypothetical protein
MILKLEEKVNIQDLIDYLEFVQQKFEPYMKNNGPWGGWSITSSNGDLYDGWQPGNRLFHSQKDQIEIERLSKLFEENQFNKPTQIYNEQIKSVIDYLLSLPYNFELSRIRIALLAPHPEEESYWHQDSDGSTKLRLHVPIATNQQCLFEYKNISQHLPADGSIFVIDVSKQHRVLNLSQSNRYHLMADIIKMS